MTYEVFLLKGQSIENSIKGNKMETYVGSLKAGELVRRYQIPRRDFAANTGYQRLPGTNRVNKLTRDLRNRQVDLPTALLLSVRDEGLRPQIDSSGRYILSLPNDVLKPFFVVDGQHRLKALYNVIVEEQDEYWAEYRIPVVIFFGSDEYLEMVQFYTVNSNAKSIPTDLAFDLLKTMVDSKGKNMKYLVENNEAWKVTTQSLTIKVSKHGVWSGRIRFSNQPPGTTLIASSSFVSSLKRVIGQDIFSSYLPDERVQIVAAYWQGIANALPECFTGNPKEYNIQKTVGG